MSDLKSSEFLDDWYVVDGAPFGQPEGTEADWRAIIAAMKEGRSESPARRVGVVMRKDGSAELYSPRNASSNDDFLHLGAYQVPGWIERAEALLNSIPQAKINAVVEELQALSEDQRREVFRRFCVHCGKEKTQICPCLE